MKNYLLLICTLFLFCSSVYTQEVQITKDSNDSLTLIFAGDIMGHSPQYKAAYIPSTNSFNYDICFQDVKRYIQTADIAIANLEVPIAGPPYSGYPAFSSPDALLDALKKAGYDILLTGNNHVLDRGKHGLERTLCQIDKRNLLCAGSYIDKIQRDSIYPLILNIKGVKLAFLNYTYGTNSNLISIPNIINYIDTLQILEDIQKAEKLGADIKIMTIHWGTEYELQANESQRRLAQYFVSHGINLIIGSHPHVVQNAEIMYGNDSIPIPVYYSVGNSLSNQCKQNTDGGIMVKVNIGTISKQVLNTSFLPIYVLRGTLHGVYQYHLIPTTDFKTTPSKYPLNKTDSLSLILFDQETRKRLSNMKIFQ